MELSAGRAAAQLRCPHGEAGMASEQAMNLRSLTRIASTFAAARLQNGGNILEAGCGNGGPLGYALSQADGLHHTGLEVSPLMHEQAQAFNTSPIAAGQADYRLYDGGALSFADAVFHKAMSVNTAYFWDDVPFALAELCRVLKSGGRLCLNFYEKDFMAKLPFATHGFMLCNVADIRVLAKNLSLRCISERRSRNWVVNRSSKLVRREFVDLMFGRV